MAYFHEDLIQNNRLIDSAVILTETGQTVSPAAAGQRPYLPNHAIRAVIQDLVAEHGNNIPTIRDQHTPVYELEGDELISFQCPVMLCVMEDPVVAADGHTYERAVIEEWFRQFDNGTPPRSPKTNEALPNRNLTPNLMLRRFIQDIQHQRQANGLPLLPVGVGKKTVSEILADFIRTQRQSIGEFGQYFGGSFRLFALGTLLALDDRPEAGVLASTAGTVLVGTAPLVAGTFVARTGGQASTSSQQMSSVLFRGAAAAPEMVDVDSDDDANRPAVVFGNAGKG